MRKQRIKVILALFTFIVFSTAFAKEVDFTLPGLDGDQHSLSDYRGKWVVVNYWATWCRPCLEEIPELEIFHNNHHSELAVVLGLNMEDINVGELKKFVEEQFISYPILLVGEKPEQILGSVPGLPTTYLVTPKGEVVARQVGPIDAKSLENFIAGYKP